MKGDFRRGFQRGSVCVESTARWIRFLGLMAGRPDEQALLQVALQCETRVAANSKNKVPQDVSVLDTAANQTAETRALTVSEWCPLTLGQWCRQGSVSLTGSMSLGQHWAGAGLALAPAQSCASCSTTCTCTTWRIHPARPYFAWHDTSF